MRGLGVDIGEATKDVLRLYRQLLAIPSTSGDEGEISDHLMDLFQENLRDRGSEGDIIQSGHMILASVGKPKLVFFGGLDTVGFMASYDRGMVPIGRPAVKGGERLGARVAGQKVEVPIRPLRKELPNHLRYDGAALPPGTRLSYLNKPFANGGRLHGAYLNGCLDLAILCRLFQTSPNIAICLVCDEKHSGVGLSRGVEFVQSRLGIQEGICITGLPVEDGLLLGRGPGISLMGPSMPRRVYVDHLIARLGRAGFPFQVHIGGRGAGFTQPAHMDIGTLGLPIAGWQSHQEVASIADLRGLIALGFALLTSP